MVVESIKIDEITVGKVCREENGRRNFRAATYIPRIVRGETLNTAWQGGICYLVEYLDSMLS